MSQNQHLQLLDNTLTFINTGTYATVEEAIACGAAYVSADISALESYTDGFRIPLYDLQDTLNAYSECLGHSDIRGFVLTSTGYVSINDLD
ncbi:hypothetical protein HT094_22520 [Shewanella sp. ZOR0012]|uniref:hypothetical protein n=1 Tax=Shewanella sp. ZOR0012 TaxID=1339231 RepID=UPI000648D0AD|nr:hypothetical protein [Shewanella sp. ZOR0012]NSM26875.1 hypothetical protein [Shewanella sp. ZOR0012]